ncbi:hypothetical protein QCQ60_005098 [Bacillus cereus]|nr:hypothetical protein [Bacillus cereus]
MPTLKLSIPDPNKPCVRISGINYSKNPLNILGEVILERTETSGGLKQYKVMQTDFPKCFPLEESYWNITDMFCNACNKHIHDYTVTCLTKEYEKLRHSSNFPVFSKHKYENGWKVLIYNPNEKRLDLPINELIDEGKEVVKLVV